MSAVIDSTTNNSSSTGRTTVTFSHTCTGANLGLTVYVGHIDAANRTVTVTYNGVAMTQEGTLSLGAGPYMRGTYFSLIAPATGANNVVVTWSGNVASSSVSVISYTGCDQTDLVEATNTSNGTNNSPNVAITSITDNAVLLAGYTFSGGDGDPSTPGDTERWDFATGAAADDLSTAGGELLQVTAGAGTINMTASASDNWLMIGLAIKAAIVISTFKPQVAFLN